MVATTSARKSTVPWYVRWEIATVLPSALLAAVMLWSVTRSIASSNWAEGLDVLVGVALLGLLIGIIFARLHWLPGWLAHILSAALGVSWSIHQIGPILMREVSLELGDSLAQRLVNWSDQASEILLRAVIWGRVLEAGGRGEDIVLFVVALALLTWALGYTTGWWLFRAGWSWWVVVLNAFMILINYTFASPKPNSLFFLFLGTALLLIVQQNVIRHQQQWQRAAVEYPAFMPWRFLLAAALFCGMIVAITSVLPGNVSSTQVARVWRTISLPLTAAREGWENAFSTINAPEGTVGSGFATSSIRVGGPRSLGDTVVMQVRSAAFDYWRAVAWDRYTGHAWQNTVGERARAALGVATEVEARSLINANEAVPQPQIAGRTLVTQTVQLLVPSNDNLLIFAGQLASANRSVLIQNGIQTDDSGAQLPNFDETAAVFAETPLQQTNVYTVETYVSTVDEQSLRAASTNYPEWLSKTYLQLPDTVTARTRDKAREIVDAAGATTPYDQAKAIQDYLRSLVYDETRAAPPTDRDWVDYFLFDSKRGYCDDFATSMVVMLRSLNIPARLVQGYAGGSLDSQINAYIVRESIGHSWPEVYFPGYGWQRFEPTPASYASVPVRPAQPSANATTPTNIAGSADIGLSELDELRRQQLEDALNRGSSAEELAALARAQQERLAQERMRQIMIVAGILGGITVGVGLFFFSLRRELRGLSPASAAYVRLVRLAGWAGLPQAEHSTPYEYANELRRSLPIQRRAVDQIVGAYVEERYRPNAHSPSAETLEESWRALRKPLLTRLFARLGTVARPTTTNQTRRR